MFRSLIGRSLIIAFSLQGPLAASSQPPTKVKPEKITWVRELAKTYGKAHSICTRVKKKVDYALMGTSKSYHGHLFIKGRHLRLELEGADKSLIIVNGDRVSVVTYPPKDSDLKIQVLHTTFARKGQAQALLKALLGGKLAENFKVQKSETHDGEIAVDLKPKSNFAEFTKVALKVAAKGYRIKEISYWDDLNNQTSYTFSDAKFNCRISKHKFHYNPPKDAEVSSM